MTATVSGTLVQAIDASLKMHLRPAEGVAEPAAILWTDPESQWFPLASIVRPVLPNFFTLGEWDSSTRTGPSIWMKCIVDRTIDEAPAEDTTPILYLPGVSRQTLRLGVECPADLQPLIELQYRGTVWHQKNGRDWTVEAFLVSELGLDIAQDARTREALVRALPLLADADIGALRGRRLDADDFDLLSVGDPVRELLRWLADPEVFQTSLEPGQYDSFRSLMQNEFGFDPKKDDGLGAAERLLEGKGRWEEAWRRFSEAPDFYRRITQRLRQAPPSLLYGDRDPRVNDRKEAELRKSLNAVADLPHPALCQRILALEDAHRERRDGVWAKLGESRLAQALEPLARLAQMTEITLGGSDLGAITNEYTARGWSVDRALIDALAIEAGADDSLVAKVARALYEPWADGSARQFQKLMGAAEGPEEIKDAPAEQKSCYLFVDGLRFDLGVMLLERLEALGFRCRLSHRLAPLPSVTATGKPLAAPKREIFGPGDDAAEFNPIVRASGQPVIASRFRAELSRVGVTVIDGTSTIVPDSDDAMAWSETAEVDSLGHKMGRDLARQLQTQLDRIAHRVAELVEVGWRVKVVTDHGWLLLPGGLPKVELPKYLVKSKWARCATLAAGATAEMTTYPWHWDRHVRIASPPGIGAYYAGEEYAHGGVSPQECVIPELDVEAASTLTATITKIEWRGMRCRVALETNDTGATIELRYHWNQSQKGDPIAAPKTVGTAGETSLVVTDDRNEGRAAVVVVIGSNGMVLSYTATTIGEQR